MNQPASSQMLGTILVCSVMAQLHVAKVVLVGEWDPVGPSGVAVTRVSVKCVSLSLPVV